jgi:hypothetical protein
MTVKEGPDTFTEKVYVNQCAKKQRPIKSNFQKDLFLKAKKSIFFFQTKLKSEEAKISLKNPIVNGLADVNFTTIGTKEKIVIAANRRKY